MGSVLVLQKDLSPSISRMPGLVPQLDNVLEVLHMTPCTPALGNVPSRTARSSAPSHSALRHSPRSSGTGPSLRSREDTGALTCRALTQTPPCASFPAAASTSWWHPWVPPGHPGPPGTGLVSVVGVPGGDFILRTLSHTSLSLHLNLFQRQRHRCLPEIMFYQLSGASLSPVKLTYKLNYHNALKKIWEIQLW